MLVTKNNTDKKLSVYSCDRSKAQLNQGNKVAIYIGLPARQPKKRWDLCR